AFLEDVAHPEERLDVVAQGRPPKQSYLGRKRRSLPWESALALDALEHRRFFAADIGAGTAPEVDPHVPRQPRRLDCGNLSLEDRAALRIFIAKTRLDLLRCNSPGGDQHAFKKAVRVGLEKIAVLEGAGLALITIDRQQPRRRLLAHEAPFAAGREARAAEPAKARMLEDLDQLFGLTLARQARFEQAIAVGRAIGVEADKFGDCRMCLIRRDRSRDALHCGVLV